MLTLRALCATTALGLSTAATAAGYPTSSNGDGAVTGGYSLSRWAEDWRGMADPAKRNDPLDRLKYLPLTADGESYLTLSGEVRLRINHTQNPGLRDLPAQRQDINRLVAGADLHITPYFRAYGELAHGGVGGENLGVPAATTRNAMVIQQAFVEGRFETHGLELGARYGRQEFVDGPNLLVSQRDNNTIRYTLNGPRLWLRTPVARIALFDLKPTAYGDLGTGDDVPDPARRFSGVSMGFVVPKSWTGGTLTFDPFVWRRRNLVGTWGGRIGPATRYYAGARLSGDIGRFTLDWSANRQWGHFMEQEIDAGQIFLAQSYKLSDKVRIGTHFDYASGGGAYGGDKLRNAYAPFGNNVYFSYGLFLTPSNLIAAAGNVTLSPTKKLRLTGEVQRVWRDDVRDAVYRANGQPYAGTQKVPDAHIADNLRFQAVWTPAPRVSFTGRFEHLAAGPSLTKAGFRSSNFAAIWASFRF